MRPLTRLAMVALVSVLSGCDASPTAPPTSVPAEVDPLAALGEGVHRHALVARQLGFYAVITPPGYDAPENRDRRYPVVVILHGSGSDELQHGQFAQDLGRDGVIYVAPRAPYPHWEMFTEHQKPGWTAWPDYPSEWGESESPTFPTAEIRALQVSRLYTTWIADAIQDARRRYRADGERVTVVGHSQGAAFAHLLAAHHPGLVKAYFAYAGYYGETTDSPEGSAHAAALRESGIRVSLVHYREDPIVDAGQTAKLDAFLTQHGIEHTTRMLAGDAHRMTAEVLAAAREFVREACRGEQAAR